MLTRYPWISKIKLIRKKINYTNTADYSYFKKIFILYTEYTHSWKLAPDIGKCQAKNRVMSDEGFFTTDTVVGPRVNFFYTLPTSYHSEAFGKYRPLLLWIFFMSILIDNLIMQFFYIPNRTMCLSKQILYQNVVVFLTFLGQLILWKHLICQYIVLKT